MAFDEDYFVFSPNNYVAKFIYIYIYIYIYDIVVPSVELILIIWSMYLLKMLIKMLVCDSAQCSCAYSTVRI